MDIERSKKFALDKIKQGNLTKYVKNVIKNEEEKEQNYKEGFKGKKNLQVNNIKGFLNKNNLNKITNLSNLGELIRVILNNGNNKSNFRYDIIDNLERLNYNILRLLNKPSNINKPTNQQITTPTPILLPIDYSIDDDDQFPDPPPTIFYDDDDDQFPDPPPTIVYDEDDDQFPDPPPPTLDEMKKTLSNTVEKLIQYNNDYDKFTPPPPPPPPPTSDEMEKTLFNTVEKFIQYNNDLQKDPTNLLDKIKGIKLKPVKKEKVKKTNKLEENLSNSQVLAKKLDKMRLNISDDDDNNSIDRDEDEWDD